VGTRGNPKPVGHHLRHQKTIWTTPSRASDDRFCTVRVGLVMLWAGVQVALPVTPPAAAPPHIQSPSARKRMQKYILTRVPLATVGPLRPALT
jgi:hypothetical protein